MRIAFIISRLAGHIFFTVVLIILLCINNDGLEAEAPYSFLKWSPVGLCGAQILLSMLSSAIMAN